MSTIALAVICVLIGYVGAVVTCLRLVHRLYWFRSPVTLWSLNMTFTNDNGHVAAGARGIGGSTHIVFMDEHSRTCLVSVEEAKNDPLMFKYIAG